MKQETKQLLEDTEVTATRLVIEGDKSFNMYDLELLATKIRQCLELKELAVIDCNLNYEQIKTLLPAISMHPTLRDMDFSKNRMTIESILDATGPEAKELLIVGLQDPTDNQIKAIAEKIASSLYLNTLTIWGLTAEQIKTLLPAITENPSLTTVDLSKNKITDFQDEFEILTKISDNPRIHTCKTSCRGGYGHDSMDAFDHQRQLMTLLGRTCAFTCFVPTEEILSLSQPKSMFSSTSADVSTNIIYHRNIDGRLLDGDVYKSALNTSTKTNHAAAASLLKRILANDPNEFPRISELQPRLSAVLYLSEQRGKRADVVKNVWNFKEVLDGQYDTSRDVYPYRAILDSYLTLNDKKAARLPLPAQTAAQKAGLFNSIAKRIFSRDEPEKETSYSADGRLEGFEAGALSLETILASLPAQSDEELEDLINQAKEGSREGSEFLLSYGVDIIKAGTDVGRYSLQEFRSSMPMNAPCLSEMSDFAKPFREAKQIFDEAANQIQNPDEPKRLFGLFQRKRSSANLYQDFDKAIQKAGQAATILEQTHRTFENLELSAKVRLLSSREISDAWQRVDESLEQSLDVGTRVLAKWGEEDVPEVSIRTLSGQLVNLTNYRRVVSLELAKYAGFAIINHRLYNSLRGTNAETILSVTGRIDTFIRQAQFLQNAAVLYDVESKTGSVTCNEIDEAVLKAVEAAAQIESVLSGESEEQAGAPLEKTGPMLEQPEAQDQAPPTTAEPISPPDVETTEPGSTPDLPAEEPDSTPDAAAEPGLTPDIAAECFMAAATATTVMAGPTDSRAGAEATASRPEQASYEAEPRVARMA